MPRATRFAAFALGALALLLALAAPGVALFPDSMSYLGTAESVAAGRGLTVPVADWDESDSTSMLAQFPPLYPVALAAPIALGDSPARAAHHLAAVAAGVTVACAAAAAATVGLAAAPLAALLVALSAPVFDAHLTALSEPLFIAIVLLLLLSLARRAPPWASGIIAAAGGLVRYAGASLSAAAALFAWLDARGRRRWTAAAQALLPGLVLQLGWRRWTAAHGAEVPRRAGAAFPGLGHTMMEGARSLGAWAAPGASGSLAMAVVAVAALPGLAWLARRGRDRELDRLLLAAAAIAATYIALLVYARLWVGGTIQFDHRVIAPLAAVGAVAVAAVVARSWAWLGAPGRAIVVALTAGWVILSFGIDRERLRWQGEGIEFDHPRWARSAAGAWLRGEGRHYVIFTNHPPAAYFLTHRPSRTLPSTLDSDTVAAFGRKLDADHGALYALPTALYPMAPADTLAQLLGLRAVVRSELGTIWVGPTGR